MRPTDGRDLPSSVGRRHRLDAAYGGVLHMSCFQVRSTTGAHRESGAATQADDGVRMRMLVIVALTLVTLLFALVAPSPAVADDEPASLAPAVGGPVILDGNDPGTHVTQITDFVRAVYGALERHMVRDEAGVNRGGGLYATGHYFNWLEDLFPDLVVHTGGTSQSYITADGEHFFGGEMAEDEHVDAVNHFTFSEVDKTPLETLATENQPSGGSLGQLVAIGGSGLKFPPRPATTVGMP